ncbi:vanadium-dependent haloperoxidase [Pseudoalteromonas luteoviolacea]|nr:vanadium-dependent haloperoxidase [Pseudoalteromonas luteoviolacea]MBQ4905192.1 vanadium-dependent haloperoxidase [Pseudoalteromonas luteoviolacea]
MRGIFFKKTNKMIKLLLPVTILATLVGCGGDSKDTPTPTTTQTPSEPTIIDKPIVEPDKSMARQWNEVTLEAIRNDYARPTVHARNLFHISAAMFDAWSSYEHSAKTYLLGNTLNEYQCGFDTSKISVDGNVYTEQETAISFAAYRLIEHRFEKSAFPHETMELAKRLMTENEYDYTFTSTDYSEGDARALGNYIASCYISYGFTDGSNEQNGYENRYYKAANEALVVNKPGNPNLVHVDRWQPLRLEQYIDQAGNEVSQQPDFLSPEWGEVSGFALTNDNRQIKYRDSHEFKVFMDPGAPPSLLTETEFFQWNFELVSIWSSHLDIADGVMIDISPNNIGNIQSLPDTEAGYKDFYNLLEGLDASQGYKINPITNQPYEKQIVPRGDYARVLAEFWADGPDSETPPGHWFVIFNKVTDHPMLERKIEGEGEVVTKLEWDVKGYFSLGGTMHDAAISAWSVKGFYDYIRPVSAIRYMAGLGQSTDPNLPNYHEQGLNLRDGLIELVTEGDELAGAQGEHINKIKLYTWRGPDHIEDSFEDTAGVGWILAENWWPYQRPTFVTPPFAGYVSGHSTYSRAASIVMTKFTGSEFFPGGMSEFKVEKDKFLVFEKGPSVDLELQWATYQDAADQCSLSRIWGGIHPPVDDIPGRKMGEKIGTNAFNFAKSLF